MARLLKIDEFDSFSKVKSVHPSDIIDDILVTVRGLNERTELEPFIRACIFDVNDTPHGPVESVDIFTHRVTVNTDPELSAFILKGRSFKTVKPKDISHQIFRLRKISSLTIAVLGYTGTLLDHAKDEFVTTAQEIGCDYALFDAVDIGRLLVSEGFICPRDGNLIKKRKCRCGYAPQRRNLNILQKATLKELENAHLLKEKAGLVILPTGAGKTRIAAQDVAKNCAGNALYVAHTHEILDIAEEEFESVHSSKRVTRIESPKDFHKKKKIKLSTIQLLSHHLQELERASIEYLIVDEFHHAAAKTYRELIDIINPKFLLGMTATPFRGDRKDVSELCNGNVLYNAELRSAIDAGILSPYHYVGCFDHIDYARIKHNGQRYSVKDLERALIIEERTQAILEKWQEYLDGKSTVGFCCSKKHAVRCAQFFNKKGVKAAVYISDTNKEERKRIKTSFKKGDTKVIFTVDVLNEGVDFPFVEGLLFLRPTESKRIFFQQLGRGLRRFTGKTEAVVLDFIGNFKNAYKVVEYVGLTPYEIEAPIFGNQSAKKIKEILNLPLGCRITFDDRVIEVFCTQYVRGENITRFNIGRILVYNYKRLCLRLGKLATKVELDRNERIHSGIYKMLFGSWHSFMKKMENDVDLLEAIENQAGKRIA